MTEKDSKQTGKNDLFSSYKEDYQERQEEAMSLQDYLALCKEDRSAYATPAERLLKAIGEPERVDTSKDSRLSRIFGNRTISRFPAFDDFYGAEETVMNIVSHLRHAAQGLEESKQVLYLLGPVGGGKSSVAGRLKELMENEPFYALAVEHEDGRLEVSPVNENPLGLFDAAKHGETLQEEYGIDKRYLKPIKSPWATKRLKEMNGDISKFKVIKLHPSRDMEVGISKTEPGDENNQDISALVGQVNIRKLETHDQNDVDAYSFSGGLCSGNRGVMEFVEMFKAPIKALNPLLEATQDGNYKPTEGFGPIPFEGIILAHSNESEWESFRNNKTNEAFIDRVNIVKVPYCLQVTEEMKIYQKLLENSELKEAPCAPGTLEMLAQFSVLTRLEAPENSSVYSKMRVYDGQNLKDVDPRAKSLQEYKDNASNNEGMSGASTRFAFKTLSKVFNFESAGGGEIAANPVHMMYVLEKQIKKADLPKEQQEEYMTFINEFLKPHYFKSLEKEIHTAYLESYKEYGQNMFDRYLTFADLWIQEQDYRDPDTGDILSREALNEELEKIEKPAGVTNPKDFRHEAVNFALRHRANNEGKNPDWTSYEKLKQVIENKMFASTEDILPVISSAVKGNKADQEKHNNYVQNMKDRGYTEKQVKLVGDWYMRVRKSM